MDVVVTLVVGLSVVWGWGWRMHPAFWWTAFFSPAFWAEPSLPRVGGRGWPCAPAPPVAPRVPGGAYYIQGGGTGSRARVCSQRVNTRSWCLHHCPRMAKSLGVQGEGQSAQWGVFTRQPRRTGHVYRAASGMAGVIEPQGTAANGGVYKGKEGTR